MSFTPASAPSLRSLLQTWLQAPDAPAVFPWPQAPWQASHHAPLLHELFESLPAETAGYFQTRADTPSEPEDSSHHAASSPGASLPSSLWGAGAFQSLWIPSREQVGTLLPTFEQNLPEGAPALVSLRFQNEAGQSFGYAWVPRLRYELQAHAQTGMSQGRFVIEGGQESRAKALNWLQNPNPPLENRTVGPIEHPSACAWLGRFEKAKAALEGENLDKLVLSSVRRASVQGFGRGFQMLSPRANSPTYQWLQRFPNGHIGLGLPPEMLLHSEGGTLATEALAGTLPLDQPAPSHMPLAHEHQAVVHQIQTALSPYGQIQTLPARWLNLPTFRHLQTPIRLNLSSPTSPWQIWDRLHPTAAVGGEPKEVALKLIGDLEDRPRGFYAGCAGVFTQGRLHLCVLLRLFQYQPLNDGGDDGQGTVEIPSGVGLVQGFSAQDEWQEMALKAQPLIDWLKSSLD